jgi:hypothetical protein
VGVFVYVQLSNFHTTVKDGGIPLSVHPCIWFAIHLVVYDRLKIHVYFSRHNVNMVNIHHLFLNLLYNFKDPCFIIICIIIENICSLIFKIFLLMLILKSEICIKTYYVQRKENESRLFPILGQTHICGGFNPVNGISPNLFIARFQVK